MTQKSKTEITDCSMQLQEVAALAEEARENILDSHGLTAEDELQLFDSATALTEASAALTSIAGQLANIAANEDAASNPSEAPASAQDQEGTSAEEMQALIVRIMQEMMKAPHQEAQRMLYRLYACGNALYASRGQHAKNW